MRRTQTTPFARDDYALVPYREVPRVCVVGAGNGGLAMAAHLALKGLPVFLYSRNEEKVAPIRKAGGIYLHGAMEGFGRIELASTDLEECVQNADVIMVTTPACAHAQVATALAPFVDGHIVVLNPGRTGGALEVHHIFQQMGARATVAEAQTFIYASRAESPTSARIFEIKRVVPVAAFPAVKTHAVMRQLQRVYSQFVPAHNVLETSFSNIGAVFHPTPLILNACKVDTGVCFDYYHEGVTPSVAELMERVDAERVAVAAALGLRVLTAREWLYEAYGARGGNLYEAIQNNGAYTGIKAPTTLDHRYIYEDVPTGLVPIASFGRVAGVPTPYTESLIQMACGLHGTDYRKVGRTVERLGLAGMRPGEIYEYVITGVRTRACAGVESLNGQAVDWRLNRAYRRSVASWQRASAWSLGAGAYRHVEASPS